MAHRKSVNPKKDQRIFTNTAKKTKKTETGKKECQAPAIKERWKT